MVCTTRTSLIGLTRNCGRSRKRVPTERSRRRRHFFGETRTSESRHRVLAFASTFKNISTRVNGPVDVSRFSRYPDFALDPVVIGLEFVIPKRPIFYGRTLWDSRGAISPSGLTDNFEVPWIQAPTLSPVMDGCSADRIHHR